MEALAVEPPRVGDVVHRRDDEVDRDDVDAAALEAHHRHPRRHQPAQLLQRLEEVHRAVDLVDLARARIADDHAGAVDAERNPRLAPHDRLGLVLRREIRMIEPFGLVEHVLAEHAFVQPGCRDRRDVVQAFRTDRRGEGDDPSRALDVHLALDLLVGGEVVDGGEMKDVTDPSLQRAACLVGDAERLVRHVAFDGHRARAVDSPERVQRFEALGRGVAHQEMNDRAAPREQASHESATDEAGGSGDEILQVLILRAGARSLHRRPARGKRARIATRVDAGALSHLGIHARRTALVSPL